MKKLLVCLLSLSCSATGLNAQTLACANDYVPNQKAITVSRSIAEELTKVELSEPWTVRKDRLRKAADAGGDFKVRNDLASALMHTGDPKAAIQILKEIERTNPGLYQTASNLGTASELAGENEKALDWIRKGIERNPKSHDSSEWIHVRILEEKIAGAKSQSWFNNDSLLGLNFSSGTTPIQPTILPTGNSGEPLTLEQVEAGLKYQLHERLQFVKPVDRIVASLLFDLGNIIALKAEGIGMAQGTYELAAKYAQSDKPDYSDIRVMIDIRLSKARNSNQKHSFIAGLVNNPVPLVFILAVSAVITLYVVGKIRESRKKRALAQS
ncbi:MAG: tetratricopeptide repeat protein [Chthoniobacteraceae bacterium]